MEISFFVRLFSNHFNLKLVKIAARNISVALLLTIMLYWHNVGMVQNITVQRSLNFCRQLYDIVHYCTVW